MTFDEIARLSVDISTPKQRRRERLHRRIERCAIELFETKGYDAVTVAEIADAAEISPRTFFRYFATKDDVLFSTADNGLENFADLLASRPGHEPAARAVRAALIAYAQQLDDQLDVIIRREGLAQESPGIRRRERARTALWPARLVAILRDREPSVGRVEASMLAFAAQAALATGVESLWVEEGKGSLRDAVGAAFDMFCGADES